MALVKSKQYLNFMSEDTYFPVNTFGQSVVYSDFLAGYYSGFLSIMDEPSLFQASRNSNLHAYRFLWLRTFHQPVVVRLQVEEQEAGLLIAKVTDGRGGYEPGKLILNETSHLSRQAVEEFLMRLKELEFWQRPTIDESGGIGIDGAQWVLEGVQDSRYHVLSRWSPKEGDFKETSLMLLRLAKVTVEYIY
jgi:hypothetical protein